MPNQQCQSTKGTTERIIIIIHEYYYGGAVALLLQDHLTMSVTEQSQCLSTTVQREHKTREGKRESPGKEDVFGLVLNTVTESLLTLVFGSEFQTAGAEHRTLSGRIWLPLYQLPNSITACTVSVIIPNCVCVFAGASDLVTLWLAAACVQTDWYFDDKLLQPSFVRR